jgi:hypothetical protein
MHFRLSVHTNTLEYAQRIHRKRIDLKTLLKVNTNENAYSIDTRKRILLKTMMSLASIATHFIRS